MDITHALGTACKAAGIDDLRLAVLAGVSQSQSGRWLRGLSNPRAPELLTLMREVPGFAELLGFGKVAA